LKSELPNLLNSFSNYFNEEYDFGALFFNYFGFLSEHNMSYMLKSNVLPFQSYLNYMDALINRIYSSKNQEFVNSNNTVS
jgi:hypothetical protein